MERIICLAAGYLCGLFQTGYIYGKLHGIDIRSYGSGNSGSTNALRVMGKKAGLTVFVGDFLKTVIPCFITRLLFKDQPELMYVYMLYTGLGVILGHNFPFYLGFKGGKGIAATAGIIFSIDWRLTVICLSCFILLVAVTRYVRFFSGICDPSCLGRSTESPRSLWPDTGKTGVYSCDSRDHGHGLLAPPGEYRPSFKGHGK